MTSRKRESRVCAVCGHTEEDHRGGSNGDRCDPCIGTARIPHHRCVTRVGTAVLIGYTVPGWPIDAISRRVPLGKRYRVDLDSERLATLGNLEHPEWGTLRVRAIQDIDAGWPLPVCCLRIES